MGGCFLIAIKSVKAWAIRSAIAGCDNSAWMIRKRLFFAFAQPPVLVADLLSIFMHLHRIMGKTSVWRLN